MKLPNLLAYTHAEPKTFLQFAASQLQGSREKQEDFFLNYNDECFVVADGVGGSPHGDVASKLGAETALWAYKLVRTRPFYWEDKKKLIARIFRSTNITLWQKQKESKYQGLATTLDVIICSQNSYWFGHVGDGCIFLYRNGVLRQLTQDHVNKNNELTNFMGLRRYGLMPQIAGDKMQSGDTILMVTDGVTNALAPQTLTKILKTSTILQHTLDKTVNTILTQASRASDRDNMTVTLIKRL